jgi:hypothetical protein
MMISRTCTRSAIPKIDNQHPRPMDATPPTLLVAALSDTLIQVGDEVAQGLELKVVILSHCLYKGHV